MLTKHSLYLAFAALFFLSCSPQPQESSAPPVPVPQTVAPEEVGLNPDSLDRITAMIEEFVAKKWIPGAAVLVARNGKIAFETVAGFKDVDSQTALATDNIFRLASMTKPFTSVAVMQLVEKGQIRLDDPVSKFIPEFADPMVLTAFNESDTTWEERPASREITIHDLLTHTSGVNYAFIDPIFSAIYAKHSVPDLATHLDYTIENQMATLGDLPLAHDPGEKFSYGLNTDILGRVVEVASGMSLADYFYSQINQPLGLKDTHFFLPDSLASRLVSVYTIGEDSVITPMTTEEGSIYHPDFPKYGAKSYYSGGSGLSGTIRDYFVFCQSLLNGGTWGESRILNDTTVTLMRTNQVGDLSLGLSIDEEAKFSYGFHLTTRPSNNELKQLPGRFNWSGAFQTTFWIDPQRDLIAVFMSQVLFTPYWYEVFNEFEKRVVNSVVEEPV